MARRLLALLVALLHSASCLLPSASAPLAAAARGASGRGVAMRGDDDARWQQRWGNKSPEEIENMKKWGKILSQADTFDGDYLDKGAQRSKGGGAAEGGAPSGELVVVGGSTLVLLLLFAATQM